MNGRRLLLLFLVIGTLCLVACEFPSADENLVRGEEQTRVTSPNGKLDAVLTDEEVGGAWGGWDSYVYIVRKGAPMIGRHAKPVIHTNHLRGQKLAWGLDHLLDFHYEIASIREFRNLWALDEIEHVRSGADDYFVEIRLVPSSHDFSLLTPDGDFRRQ